MKTCVYTTEAFFLQLFFLLIFLVDFFLLFNHYHLTLFLFLSYNHTSCLFFSSNLPSPHSPMNLDSWCSILTPDLYILICKSLGCAPEEENELVASAIRESLLSSSSSISLFSTRNNTQSIQSSYSSNNRNTYRMNSTNSHDNNTHFSAVSSHLRQSISDQISDSVLTPIKTRKEQKYFELENATPLLGQTQRGVRDLQTILAYELARIATIGSSTQSRYVSV